MRKKIWKSLIAVGCAVSLLITVPEVLVLANEIGEDTSVIDEVKSENDYNGSYDLIIENDGKTDSIDNSEIEQKETNSFVYSYLDDESIGDLSEEQINDSTENNSFSDISINDGDTVIEELIGETDIQHKMIEVLYNGAGGWVSCDFDGYVNTSGRHEGIDFCANGRSGTSIYSLIDGTVTKCTNTGSNGLSTCAIYDETNDKTVVYLHGHFSVSAGTYVTKGTYLGYEYNHGASSAHTHIEVRNGYRTAAAKSVNDYTLDNPNPYGYWNTVMGPSIVSGKVDVSAGNSSKLTSIWWDAGKNATSYDVKIWKGTLWEGDAYQILWGVTGTSCEINLPAGYYEGYVDYRNGDDVRISRNTISFTVDSDYAPKPNWANVSIDKETPCAGENITFTFSSDQTAEYTIGIYDGSENRIDTHDVARGGNTYTRSFGQAGNYSCYVTAHNENGWVDSERIYFYIYEKGKEMTSGNKSVLPDGDYIIVSAAAPTLFLDIEGTDYPANGGDNVHLCQMKESDNLSACDVWNIQYSDGFYTIRQKGTDMCLDVSNGDTKLRTNIQVAASNRGSAQKWAISWYGDGRGYKVQSKCSGYSLDVNGGVIASGTNVQQWEANGSEAQRWLFIPYEPPKTINNGRYILVSALDPHLVLDISGNTGDIANGTNVQVWNDEATAKNNAIDVEYLGHGYYRLKQAASGKCIDLRGGNVAINANIQMYDAAETNNQKWAIVKNGNGYNIVSRSSGLVWDVVNSGTADGTNVQQYYYAPTDAQVWKFVRAEYSVKYDANGGTGAPGTQTKYYANALTLSSTKPAMSGKTFKGWATSKTATTASYQPGGKFTENKDVTLYAVWSDVGVTGVSLNVTSATMNKGETKQLTATVSPSNAKDKSVTWTSSNTAVATVSASGLVTAVGGGSADITVKTKDGGKTAVCKVTVPMVGLDLNGYLDGASSGGLGKYGTADIYINGTRVADDVADYCQKSPAGSKYEIKDIKAKTGYVYNGVQSGSLTGTIGTARVNVVLSFSTRKVTGVSVNPSTASLRVGETKQLTAAVSPSDALDRSVTWSSSNASVAKVDSAGKVTAVGEGSANITAKTTDGGKTSICKVTVTRADISGCTITLSQTSFTYDGKAKQPSVTVKNGSKILVSGTDYTVSYKNNTNAGTATVIVTGKGNYIGSISKTFAINQAVPTLTFASASVTKTTLDAAFTNALTKKTDGTVTFKSSNTNVATVDSNGKVTIKGAGASTITAIAAAGTNYKAGSAGYDLTVVDGKQSISGYTVTLSPASYTYNGSACKPAVTVKNGSKALVSGTDYSVSYKNNTNAGTATVTVTGKGNYTGMVSRTFTINKAAAVLKFASANVEKTSLDAAFTNELTKKTDGKVTFKSGDTGVAVVDSTSGLVTIKGTGTTTITATTAAGTNYKAGSAVYTLKVVDGRIDITSCTVTLSTARYTYNGKARKPVVTVSNGSTTLTNGTDYTVSYKNNTNAGTATAIVAGKGNYTGTVSKTFTIRKAAPKLAFASEYVSKNLDDDAFINELSKTTDGIVTFESDDEKVARVDSSGGIVTIKGAGKATIRAIASEGKNYKAGTAEYVLEVKDDRIDIADGEAATKYPFYEYNGSSKQPAMILKVGSVTLVKGRDYTLAYKNNKEVGTATITATGIGKYKGTKSCNFYIKELIPVYRLFNTRTGEHFYTASTTERQRYLNAGNWNSEGIAWYAPKKSSEPIYRLSNPNNGNEHHYTKSKSEKDWLVGLGWHYDCIAWYSDTDKIVPIYRHYHPIQRTGNHHYTTSKGESDHIVKYEGWRYEGISFYVSKAGG